MIANHKFACDPIVSPTDTWSCKGFQFLKACAWNIFYTWGHNKWSVWQAARFRSMQDDNCEECAEYENVFHLSLIVESNRSITQRAAIVPSYTACGVGRYKCRTGVRTSSNAAVKRCRTLSVYRPRSISARQFFRQFSLPFPNAGRIPALLDATSYPLPTKIPSFAFLRVLGG